MAQHHAIIKNHKLAQCFEEYIKWDFQEAQRVPLDEAPEPAWPDVFVPVEVTPERVGAGKYFDPLIIDRELDVTPLLTPDRDSRGKRMFMTMTPWRPGNLVSAIQAPRGMPISAASTTAERLT